MLLQAFGVLMQAAGLGVLFLHWRAKAGLGGAALGGAWALIVIGAAPWLSNASPEKALALGALAPMVFGLALLAPDAVPRVAVGKVRRDRRVRAEPGKDLEVVAPGRASRTAARWFGALIAAPALAAAAAAAWLAHCPWGAVDSVVFSAFLMTGVLAGALLWLLAAVRPWRAGLFAFGVALLLAAIAGVGAH